MKISLHGIQAIRNEFLLLLNETSLRKNHPHTFDAIAAALLADLGGMMGEW